MTVAEQEVVALAVRLASYEWVQQQLVCRWEGSIG
jgi:hypothetical protein